MLWCRLGLAVDKSYLRDDIAYVVVAAAIDLSDTDAVVLMVAELEPIDIVAVAGFAADAAAAVDIVGVVVDDDAAVVVGTE